MHGLAEDGSSQWHREIVPFAHERRPKALPQLALAGSANLDSRSLFLNYELMFAFHDAGAIAACSAWFEGERSLAARHLPQRPGLLVDLADGLVLWMGFQL